ncbi:hypothetical protein BKA61DRAFT_721009 [Leptodontidium sp. MPI-SDFR-AT-0119]|nr:hypothetical protein BKA61DRAFT_721009 [Leptodontidium sp. MPI-SDFR-AT-0119]
MTTQLSVDQTLRLTQRELVQFVQQNITHEDGTWNVSNIVDWEDVSQAKRDLLAAKLLPAVQKTTEPSVNATYLAALLAQIPSDRGSPTRQTQYLNPSRSSTVEPPDNAIQEYETKCYQALLDDSCRPLFLVSLLLQVSTNADAYTTYCGRGRDTRREFERMGVAAGWIARPDFKQAIRGQWEDEYGHDQQHPGNGDNAGAILSKYTEATKRLIMDCGFVQPFELHADPKQQDQWTTYVEYLAFECFWLSWFARFAQKLRVQHDASHGHGKGDVYTDEKKTANTSWSELTKSPTEEPIITPESHRRHCSQERSRRRICPQYAEVLVSQGGSRPSATQS